MLSNIDERECLSYKEIKNLYSLIEKDRDKLYSELSEGFKTDIYIFKKEGAKAIKRWSPLVDKLKKKNIAESEMEMQNRFYTDITDIKNFDEDNIPEIYIDVYKVNIPSEQEYTNNSKEEKKKLEKNLYKDYAIISARLVNLFNSLKSQGEQCAYSEKNLHIERFLLYACKYNSTATEEEQLFYGFKNYEEPYMDAFIPGYNSILSVHFGSRKNFESHLKVVNIKLLKDGFEQAFHTRENGSIDNKVFTSRENNVPRYGATNTGLINKANYNDIENWIKLFLEKSRNKEKEVNEEGIEEFININGADLNDREIVYIANRAGVGKKIIIELLQKLKERVEIKESAKNHNRTLTEEYIFSMETEKFESKIKKWAERINDDGDITMGIIRDVIGYDNNDEVNINNIIELIKKSRDNEVRQIIYDEFDDLYMDGIKDILIERLKETEEEKKDKNLYDEIFEMTTGVPLEKLNQYSRIEEELMEWLKAR